jgi:hypothetical protein
LESSDEDSLDLGEMQAVEEAIETFHKLYEAHQEAERIGKVNIRRALKFAETEREFDELMERSRERVGLLIEILGPPEGWVRVENLAEQGGARRRGKPVDSLALRGNTEGMAENTELSRELQLRDDQLRRDMAAQRELADEKMKGFDDRMKAFMDNQAERDTRIEEIATRATKAAESAATVKSNYWAAVGVQLLAVAAILVGAYFATQANTMSAITTTLSAYQAGKTDAPAPPPPPPAPKPAKP